jgi:uncharacterized protein (DUF924 family)
VPAIRKPFALGRERFGSDDHPWRGTDELGTRPAKNRARAVAHVEDALRLRDIEHRKPDREAIRGFLERLQQCFAAEAGEVNHVDYDARMIDEVLEFWFGKPATNSEEYGGQVRRWYMGGPALDAEIREKFGTLVERALAGELDSWTQTTRGRVALVLLLDQFTRSVYRDDPKTYAGDAKAQALAVAALDAGLDRELSIAERNFLVMPLTHAEDLALQERSARVMETIYNDAPDWQQAVLKMGLEQTKKYRDLIARFGRFPHRNKVLGRPSTPEEAAFLVDWEAKMRPSGAKDLPS